MRKLMLAAAAVAVFGTFAPSQAGIETVTLVEGDILIGNPGSKALGGAAELWDECGASADLQGVDGLWFEVPEEGARQKAPATLVTTGDTAIDVDVWWYTSDCSLILEPEDVAYEMATDLEANEEGHIPENAAYGIVDFAIGAAAHVKLTAQIEYPD